MPISLPNLDDRRYDDLVAEALALIPVHAPEWTNHNPSDPGITLVELFAYLTEGLIYRLNRVTTENRVAFLNLIDGEQRNPDAYRDPDMLAQEARKVIRELRRPGRAVTAEDYETLVLEKFKGWIARVKALPRRNLESSSKTAGAPAHISVVVLPARLPLDSAGLLKEVKKYLEPLRLLTTIVHVVEPVYIRIAVQFTLHLKPDAVEETVRTAALERLSLFFDPLEGWRDGEGWPFGRYVYLSEIIEQLARVPGVDYVTKTKEKKKKKGNDEEEDLPPLLVIPPSIKDISDGAVPLEAHELVDFSAGDTRLKMIAAEEGGLTA